MRSLRFERSAISAVPWRARQNGERVRAGPEKRDESPGIVCACCDGTSEDHVVPLSGTRPCTERAEEANVNGMLDASISLQVAEVEGLSWTPSRRRLSVKEVPRHGAAGSRSHGRKSTKRQDVRQDAPIRNRNFIELS